MIPRGLLRYSLSAAMVCTGAPLFAQFNVYYLTHLGPSGNGDSLAINQAGEVVGTNSSHQPFVYSMNGGMQILGSSGYATAINDTGQIAMSVGGHAKIYTRNTGQLTDLGTLGGGMSYPFAINSTGTVVGQSTDATGQFYPFMYSGGQIYNLGSFGGATPQCAAAGVNSSGEPVGTCWNPTGYFRAFYVSKFLRDFDPSHITYRSGAYAINDSGVAVGASNRVRCSILSLNVCQGQYLQPTVFNPNGTIQVLGSFAPGDAWANAINNPGDIVGSSYSNSGRRGFIYTHGTLYDLNSATFLNSAGVTLSGWVIQSADGINDSGQIVGTGYNPSGTLEIVTLTPVPALVASVTVNPATVVGGNPSGCTVTLTRPVPAGSSVTVALSSSNGAAQVPSSVTINYPNSSAYFTITTSYVPSTTYATITASYASSSKNAVLTLYDPGS